MPSGGKHPRNFMIEPSGHFAFVANRDSDNVVIFTIDDQGDLGQTATSIEIPSAICVKYLMIRE